MPVVAVRGTVTEHNSSRTRVTATQVVAAAAVETTAAPTKVVSPGSATNESVESFLQELGLERFSTACEEEGYDSLRLLAQMYVGNDTLNGCFVDLCTFCIVTVCMWRGQGGG